MSAITEAVISTINGIGRILYLRPFNEHVGTSVTDGPNIQDIVRGSRAFRTTSAEISGKVEADFAEAEVRRHSEEIPSRVLRESKTRKCHTVCSVRGFDTRPTMRPTSPALVDLTLIA